MVEFLYQNDIHVASGSSPASATLKFSRFLNASCSLSQVTWFAETSGLVVWEFLVSWLFSFAWFSRCCTNLSLEQSSPLPADLLLILSDMSRSLCPPGSPLHSLHSSPPSRLLLEWPELILGIVLTAVDCNQFVSFTDKAVNYWRSGATSYHLYIPKT